MIYEFYFRFLGITKKKKVSIILSKMALFCFFCLFSIKRLLRKRKIIKMDFDKALATVNGVYAKPIKQKLDLINNPVIDENIKLSIVVPIYNKREMVKKCIDSILKQNTSYLYEVILIDDGSTDGTRDLLLEYKNIPCVKLLFQDNQGIAGARNKGIDIADGQYLMFVDCDDTIHDDMVQLLLDIAIHDNLDIVMCGHNLSKESNGIIYQTIPYIYPEENLFNYNKSEEILNYSGLPWGKLYKRELWNNVRFLQGYWYEDTIIQWLLFSQCKRFRYIPKVEYEYRWYSNNFSKTQGNQKNPKAIDRYWMLTDIIDKYISMGLPLNNMFYILLLKHLSAFYYSNIKGFDESVVEALFVLAQELLIKYCPRTSYQLPYMLRLTERALLTGDINLWKLTSQYQ